LEQLKQIERLLREAIDSIQKLEDALTHEILLAHEVYEGTIELKNKAIIANKSLNDLLKYYKEQLRCRIISG
jgi:hypothetical protein